MQRTPSALHLDSSPLPPCAARATQYLAEPERYPDGTRFFNVRGLLGTPAAGDDDDIGDAPLLLVRRAAELVL